MPDKAISSGEGMPARRRGKPKVGDELMSPSETSGYVRRAKVALDLPPIDIADVEQVRERVYTYLEHCAEDGVIPTKSGAAAWLGIDRSTLNSWKRGEYRQNTHHEFAQRLDRVFESMLVELLLSNKIFPASGIFLLKNYNDFRDQIDIAPTVSQPLGDLPDPEVLRKKIEANAIED